MKEQHPPRAIPFQDITALDEDSRIDMIVHHVTVHGKVAGVIVDHDADKVERYRAKIAVRPGVVIEHVGPGPVQGSTLIRVAPKPIGG